MPAVALTDHGSLAGAVELVRETGKHGVKPLIGCEVYVADDRRPEEGLRASHAAGGEQRRLPQPAQAVVGRLPRGLLLQAARRLGAARAALERPRRAVGLPLGPRCKALEETGPTTLGTDLDRLAQVFGRDSTYVESRPKPGEPVEVAASVVRQSSSSALQTRPKGTRERNEAVECCSSSCHVDARLVVVALEVAGRRQLEQVAVAVVVLRQQRGVRVVLPVRGGRRRRRPRTRSAA